MTGVCTTLWFSWRCTARIFSSALDQLLNRRGFLQLWKGRHMQRVWILLTFCAVLLASCGAPPPSGNATPAVPGVTPTSGSETVTISFAVWEYERNIYQPLADRFMTENPNIKIVLVSLDDIMMVESGNEGPTNPLDVLRRIVSAADTAPAFALTPEAFGTPLLLDLKPLMDADAAFQRDDFFPGAIERYTAKGGVWALPRYHSVPLIVYNRALFQNANLPEPRPGWTWDDLMAAAERLTERSGLTTLTYGFMEPTNGLLPLLGLLEKQGINPLTVVAEETDLTAPEYVAAVERIQEWYRAGVLVAPYARDAASDDPTRL
ncbi:MAG: ABC transporter substrate-binding protein, partial [Roseiflexus castenholzii]